LKRPAISTAAFLTAFGSLIYILGPPEHFALPFRAKYLEHLTLVRLHGIGASLTLLLGPVLLFGKWSRTHRYLGYIYLLGLTLGAATAVPMAFMAVGTTSTKAGFLIFALMWLYCGVRALVTARSRSFDEHRMWVIRSFALAFGAVTLRLYLFCAERYGSTFYDVYPTSVWVAWIPCVIVGEYVAHAKLNRR